MRGLVFGLLSFFVFAGVLHAQPNVAANLENLAKARNDPARAHAHYFFHDVQDAVSFFMKQPDQVKYYTNSSGFENSAPLSIASTPLCPFAADLSPITGSKVIEAYNNSPHGSSIRRNFWIAANSCLAAHEGAEAWLSENTSSMNKLDVPGIPHRKYLYGIFQLSTEKGAAVDKACQASWKNFSVLASTSGLPEEYLARQSLTPPLSDLTARGTTSTATSVEALGRIDRQRFNIMCGVHETLRAAAGSGEKCLDPFHKSQNRYGPLRSQSNAYKKCMEAYVLPIMNAGEKVDTIIESIAGPAAAAAEPQNLDHIN